MPPEDITVQLSDGRPLTLRTVEEISPSYYVNNATFGMTQWDIKVDLSEITGFVAAENPESPAIALVSKKARLVMTVDYAKAFASALLQQVAKHELIEEGAPKEPESHQPPEPPKGARLIRKKPTRK